jgi:hypothetical protein
MRLTVSSAFRRKGFNAVWRLAPRALTVSLPLLSLLKASNKESSSRFLVQARLLSRRRLCEVAIKLYAPISSSLSCFFFSVLAPWILSWPDSEKEIFVSKPPRSDLDFRLRYLKRFAISLSDLFFEKIIGSLAYSLIKRLNGKRSGLLTLIVASSGSIRISGMI